MHMLGMHADILAELSRRPLRRLAKQIARPQRGHSCLLFWLRRVLSQGAPGKAERSLLFLVTTVRELGLALADTRGEPCLEASVLEAAFQVRPAWLLHHERQGLHSSNVSEKGVVTGLLMRIGSGTSSACTPVVCAHQLLELCSMFVTWVRCKRLCVAREGAEGPVRAG